MIQCNYRLRRFIVVLLLVLKTIFFSSLVSFVHIIFFSSKFFRANFYVSFSFFIFLSCVCVCFFLLIIKSIFCVYIPCVLEPDKNNDHLLVDIYCLISLYFLSFLFYLSHFNAFVSFSLIFGHKNKIEEWFFVRWNWHKKKRKAIRQWCCVDRSRCIM